MNLSTRAMLLIVGSTLAAYAIAAHHATRIAQIQLQQHIQQIQAADALANH
jgi:hypothetical protein